MQKKKQSKSDSEQNEVKRITKKIKLKIGFFLILLIVLIPLIFISRDYSSDYRHLAGFSLLILYICLDRFVFSKW